MLQQLLSRLQPKVKRVLGFRLARELDDCGKDIMAVFRVADFYRDYEDTWEWVESSKGEPMHVNISRPHNWKTGDYDVPVVVHVSGPAARLTDELFFGCAQQIADRLRTEVWIGQPVFQHKDDRHYEFDIETRFSPVA
jgi:hypothetical protein